MKVLIENSSLLNITSMLFVVLHLKLLLSVFVQRKTAFLCRSPYDQTELPADHSIWHKTHSHF